MIVQSQELEDDAEDSENDDDDEDRMKIDSVCVTKMIMTIPAE